MLKTQRIPSFYGIFVIVALLPQILRFNGSAIDDIYKISTIAIFAVVLFGASKFKMTKVFPIVYLLLTFASTLCTCIGGGYSIAKGMFNFVLLIVLYTLFYIFPQELYLDSRKSIFDFYYVYAMFMLFACIYNMIKHFSSLIHIMSITIYNSIRICSFFDNENTFGVYLLFGVIAALAMRIYSKKKKWTLLVFIFMINEYMAMCRTAMLISVIIVVIALAFTDYKKYKLLFFISVILIAFIVTILMIVKPNNIFFAIINNAFENTDSLDVRDKYVSNMLPLIRGVYALFGYGDDKASSLVLTYTGNHYYHNTYLKIMMTGGLFKMILQAILILGSVRNSLFVYKKDKVDGMLCFISVITYLIYASVEAVILLDTFVISIVATIFVVTFPRLFSNLYRFEN